jgi:DNA excision repair protein ERCC-4
LLMIADNEPEKIRNAVLREAKRQKVMSEVTHLKVGDFVFDGNICVERKTVGDFIRSVYDGRVFTQASDMAQYPHGYIIIVGTFEDVKNVSYLKGFSIEKRLRSQCSILARTTVKILYVDNAKQFVDTLFILREKHGKGDNVELVERHSKTLNRLDANKALFLSIPGIGPASLKRVCDQYATFYQLLRDVRSDNVQISLSKEGLSYLKQSCGIK